ncbi:MAG: nucleotidyltransferase family protein [Vicinamibacterales bacterium]
MLAAAVLAAGLSTRMGGRPKGLLKLDDRDVFVARIVRTFNEAGIREVVVVVGHEAAAVQHAVESSGLAARCVLNPEYERGQLSSMVTAINAVDHEGNEGLLLSLVDAPLFAASTVRALVDRFASTGAPVVRAVRGSEHGHPVLIGRALFDAIRQADPTIGAKPIIRRNASAIGDVAVADAGAFVDIDTPDDYARLPELIRRLDG